MNSLCPSEDMVSPTETVTGLSLSPDTVTGLSLSEDTVTDLSLEDC